MASQLARQFCQQPQQKGLPKRDVRKDPTANKGNILIKQTMWDYEDFLNPEIHDPPKKCFYRIMAKDEFISQQNLRRELSEGQQYLKKNFNVSCKLNKKLFRFSGRRVASLPEENPCVQKNPRFNSKHNIPMAQIQQQMSSDCQQKQKRFPPNPSRPQTNETDKCRMQQPQQGMAQPPAQQQPQQRANPRTKSLPTTLSSAMNFQPRPGPGCVVPVPQPSPPAETFNNYMPSNANKNKCQPQGIRCPPQPPNLAQQQQRYPQSQTSVQPQPNSCLKSRAPSPGSAASSRPCSGSSGSTVNDGSPGSQIGTDQGYVPGGRSSQTSSQCVMKQQLQTSISQPCPPHNYNARPPQIPRNRQGSAYSCNSNNRSSQFTHQSGGPGGGNVCAMAHANSRRNNQCGVVPSSNFQYEGQQTQHQVDTQQFCPPPNVNVNDMQSCIPPSEPIPSNDVNQHCTGSPQSGFNQCGNVYQKVGTQTVRSGSSPARSGRGCNQFSTPTSQCENGEPWNRNMQQECCYTSDTDNCDADGDNRCDDTSGYPTGDEYNCECFSDTADEYCPHGGNNTDDEQNCDMGFDDDCNASGCNQNNCTFQVQDYGHASKEECQCGNQNQKACIPDCLDNKVQVVIQIPQHLGRQQLDERKQEDDFDGLRGMPTRNQSQLMPSNTQTTQTSNNESRNENREPPAQASSATLCQDQVLLDKTSQQGSCNSQLPIILMPQPQKNSDCETEILNTKADEESFSTNDIKIYYNPQTFNIQSFIESVQTSKLIYYPPPQSFNPIPTCPSIDTSSIACVPQTQTSNSP